MAKGFSLSIYPGIYVSKFDDSGWSETYMEQPHLIKFKGIQYGMIEDKYGWMTEC